MDLSQVRLMIASPCKPAALSCAYVLSLMNTKKLLDRHGVHLRYVAIPDCAWIGHGRAAINAIFMGSDCTHLLMIDSDISWAAEDVVRLIEHDVPFVGAIQPSRKMDGKFQFGSRAARNDAEGKGKVRYNGKTGLMIAERISGAFTLIRRDCIERMMQAYPELHVFEEAAWYLPDDIKARPFFYAFWAQHCENGYWPGEDHAFCDRMNDAGIPTLVDPWVELGHWVEVCKQGSVADYYKLADQINAAAGEAA